MIVRKKKKEFDRTLDTFTKNTKKGLFSVVQNRRFSYTKPESFPFYYVQFAVESGVLITIHIICFLSFSEVSSQIRCLIISIFP